MLELTIPGRPSLRLEHLVLDYNGTIAVDGRLAPGVAERVQALAPHLSVHVITADTFGLAAEQTRGLFLNLTVIGPGEQAAQKRQFVERLGASGVVAVGNGANDAEMFQTAALAVCVMGPEGAATRTLMASHVTVPSAADGLDLLLKPGRLAATLRI